MTDINSSPTSVDPTQEPEIPAGQSAPDGDAKAASERFEALLGNPEVDTNGDKELSMTEAFHFTALGGVENTSALVTLFSLADTDHNNNLSALELHAAEKAGLITYDTKTGEVTMTAKLYEFNEGYRSLDVNGDRMVTIEDIESHPELLEFITDTLGIDDLKALDEDAIDDLEQTIPLLLLSATEAGVLEFSNDSFTLVDNPVDTFQTHQEVLFISHNVNTNGDAHSFNHSELVAAGLTPELATSLLQGNKTISNLSVTQAILDGTIDITNGENAFSYQFSAPESAS